MLRQAAAAAARQGVVSSWKLDSSSTHTSALLPCRCSHASSTGVPMLPATMVSKPLCWQRCPTRLVVVVLPLLPVMARMRSRWSRSRSARMATSPVTTPPRCSNSRISGCLRLMPGLRISMVRSVNAVFRLPERAGKRGNSAASSACRSALSCSS